MKPLKHLPYLILAAAILIAWQVSDFDVRCLIVVVTALVLVVLGLWSMRKKSKEPEQPKPSIGWHPCTIDEDSKLDLINCGKPECRICNPKK